MTGKIKFIMLIDDNKIDNFFHERIIKKYDPSINVKPFSNAEAALEYLISGVEIMPEIIFLDINMPRMNGWEFLEEYKKMPMQSQRSMIVVMLTTSENPDDHARASTNGILSAFKSKPLTIEMLEEAVDIYKNRYP